MQSRQAINPIVHIKSDLVHETVHIATVGGKDLDALIASEVLRQIGVGAMDHSDITWKVVHRNETTATEGTRQIAEVTIVVDHRTNTPPNSLTLQVRAGDVVSLPAGHHWMELTSLDGGCAYVVMANDKTFR